MSRDSRRLFSSYEHLSAIDPRLLVQFLQHFAPYLNAWQITIPSPERADTLDHHALVAALVATGPQMPDALADALFLINAIATPKNRKLLESEVSRRRVAIAGSTTDTHADYALKAWLHDSALLEAAAARAVLLARRSFAYFVPTSPDIASHIPSVTDTTVARLTAKLQGNLGPKTRGRGLTIIPYLDSPLADWYLIRRSRLPERITFHNEDGNEEHKSVWLRVYDVAVFDRITGILKVNCREGVEDSYRTAFGSIYTGEMMFFDDRPIFTLDPLRSADVNTLDCRDVPGIAHAALEYCEYERYRFGTLMKESVQTTDWYEDVGGRAPPVPEDAAMTTKAVVHIAFSNRKGSTTCCIHRGNRLAFSRDEHAPLIEDLLRKRGFMQHVQIVQRDLAA